MAFEIPPWLTPPNYAGIMEAAARLSLGRRSAAASELESAGRLNLAQQAQDDSLSESGDRLREAYAQIQSQERLQSEAQKQRLSQEAIGNALRSRELDIMQKYHEGMVQNGQDRINAAGTDEPFVPSSMEVAGHTLLQMGPNRYQLAPERRPPDFHANPVDLEQSKIYSRQITALQKAMDATDDPREKDNLGLALRGAQGLLDKLRSRFVAPAVGPSTSLALNPGTATPAAAAPLPQSPYAEGQVIRSKKDPSKKFVIHGGVPVPMPGFGPVALNLSAGASLGAGAAEETDDGTDDESDTEQ